jgi:predicted exporter
VFYAAAARSAAAREMDMISIGSVVGITLMMLIVFRSPQPLLLGLLTVGIALAAATAVALLAYRELHLLTLVFGASLIGEAIDYPIQYFAAHAEAGPGWQPRRTLSAVRPGLTFALATSLMGYAALVWMPFPAIGQIALFALTGLTAAYLTVVLLLPLVLRRAYRHDLSDLTAPARRFLDWWRERVGRRAAIVLSCVVMAACAPGWLQLSSDDDVRAMSSRPPELLRQESTIRRVTGIGFGAQLFLVEGSTPEAVLRHEEALVARLRGLAERGAITHFHAISQFVPSAARQADNRALVQRALLTDTERLGRIFDDLGFPANTASALSQAWRAGATHTLTLQRWLKSTAAVPYRHLWLGNTPSGYASIVLPFGHGGSEALAGAASGLDGVVLVDKVGAVSGLVRDYRTGFGWGLVVAIAATLLVLSVRYGPGGAAAVVLPALLGIGVALGAFGYAGVPVTLFTVMALLLVLGVGANYAIFLVEGAGREGMTFIAVLLSAATTLLSFGLLALSGTPALARFGMTLTLGIATAFVTSPLALALCRGGPKRMTSR